MKYSASISLLVLGFFLGGCAQEALYVDREHGIASNDAFDQQIVHKDYKYAGKPVDGLESIYIENALGRYLETYKEGFTREGIDLTEVGVEGGE
jgi:hypothetical protein